MNKTDEHIGNPRGIVEMCSAKAPLWLHQRL